MGPLSTLYVKINAFVGLQTDYHKGVVIGGAGGAAAPPIIGKIQGKRGKTGQKRMFCPPNILGQYVLPPQYQNHNYIIATYILSRLVRFRVSAHFFWNASCALNEGLLYLDFYQITVKLENCHISKNF